MNCYTIRTTKKDWVVEYKYSRHYELNLPNAVKPKGDIEEIKKKYPNFRIE